MRGKLLIVVLSVAFLCGFSQQLPQYTQYMLNELVINPAVAGRDDFSEMRLLNRQQWTGIPDAPRTSMLTLQGPIIKDKMGIGLHMYADIVGPTRRTGLNVCYAYHLKLNKEYNLSFGLNAGVMQFGIDGNKITLHDQNDEQNLVAYRTTAVPDFGAGIYFYKKDFMYFGVSIPQMYKSPIWLFPGADSRLASQLNINGGIKIPLDEKFTIEPSFLVKYEKPAPAMIDVGVRGIYKKEIWLGVVYRHMDAVSPFVGYMYKDYLMIGYSYGVTVSRLQKYTSGTHEIMLGLKFTRKQASTWETKTK